MKLSTMPRPTILARHTAPPRRRGSVYVTVLGVSTMIATLGLGAILAGRATTRTVAANTDVADARLAAQAGIELARKWIALNPAWRSTAGNGAWATEVSLGGRSRVTIEATDPVDGNIPNRPHDPLTLTATGKVGRAVYKLRATLTASPTPLPALGFAVHTGGHLDVDAGKRLRVGDATVSTNGPLENEGTIEGNASVGSVLLAGKVWGTLASGVPAKAMPASSVAETYAALGTEIPTATVENRLLSPSSNPWGTPSADGVYVIRTDSDVMLRNVRVYGTLIVICPGRRVETEGAVFVQPARPDYPALVVVGDLQVAQDTLLSEASCGVNFNAAGAPYAGVTDGDMSDVYPNELRGLVHATGRVEVESDVTIRGALIAESTSTSDAVEFQSSATVDYDPTLVTSPPQGYTSQVKMVVEPGSYRQVVD